MADKLLYKQKELNKFILPLVKEITSLYNPNRTIIIGIQGGQGTGKTTLGKFLKEDLRAAGYKVQSFSIDDFYTSFEERNKLRAKYKHNPFYQISRGLPGTHRVNILQMTIDLIRTGKPFDIPRFDKSLHNAAGDILNKTIKVKERQDFILFEGWCLGIHSVSSATLQRICTKHQIDLRKLDPTLNYHKVVLRFIKDYQLLWPFIDYMVMLKPDSAQLHKEWRWQQAKELKQETGRGMTRQDVDTFVNSYLPFTYLCYEKVKPNVLLLINKHHKIYKIIKMRETVSL